MDMTKSDVCQFLTRGTKNAHYATCAFIPYAGFSQIRSHILILHVDYIFSMNTTTALDLWSITNELGSVIDKWFRIGVQLRLSEAKLRQIEADHRTVDRYFSEVISFWFNGNTQVAVSWKSLIEVLESPFVDEKGLAKKLREKGGMELHNGNAAPSSTGVFIIILFDTPSQ